MDESAAHQAVLDALDAPMVPLGPTGTIEQVNRAWTSFGEPRGGCPTETGVGANYLDACRRAAHNGDDDAVEVLAGLQQTCEGDRDVFVHEYECSHGDERRWFSLRATALPEDGGLVVQHTEVTEQVLCRQQRDDVTGLASRLAIVKGLARALAERTAGHPVSVLVLDLDVFVTVNDGLGFEAGDQLLRDLAARLVTVTRPADLLGRLTDGSFAVVAHDCDGQGADQLARRLRDALSQPFDVDGESVPVSVGIGLATSSGTDVSALELLHDANTAQRACREEGHRYRVYTPDLSQRARDRIDLSVGLRAAIHAGQLRLHYQPVLSLGKASEDDCLCGVEALVRWEHPERGLLSPASFIPLAEESGLIVPLTRWVLAEAARQQVAWARQGRDVRMAVNVSAEHLTAGSLVDDAQEAADVAGMKTGRLLVELTETSLARDAGSAAGQLRALRQSGIAVAIDDFGTGYSSLGQLAQLPVDVLKLDRSLMSSGDGSHQARINISIMEAVVAVAKSMNLQVLAEGVETKAELEAARRTGCSLAQGYLLGRPEPAV